MMTGNVYGWEKEIRGLQEGKLYGLVDEAYFLLFKKKR